jgi:predicted DNA-binding transcriptional regulator AlpA
MNPTLPNRPVIHLPELAAAAGVCTKTLQRLAKSGKIPPGNRIGRALTWPRDVALSILGITPAPSAA